ncbi:uncharacterized protein LY79DRAFT_285914 [Colletotrichum navitas]|uniref:Secreted protein n=1 Tax=Colletotrichum navitas TaxID=681940 RepID=A0AAD8V8J9_9PEZI|nr:uncharacterized protein LY79DRAFT_285914 [Colletotrichum navitas]KAK1598322.1 hypothetical protein LY79DRAFT_285914 [Colletotrichum navitas]
MMFFVLFFCSWGVLARSRRVAAGASRLSWFWVCERTVRMHAHSMSFSTGNFFLNIGATSAQKITSPTLDMLCWVRETSNQAARSRDGCRAVEQVMFEA